MRQELKRQISLPIILTTVFLLSSFVPVIQLIILTMNGGYLAVIDEMISSAKSNTKTINLIGNLLPILIFLFWFYSTKNKAGKVISAILSMVFMTAFFHFMSIDENEEHEPYWLQFLVIALVSGVILTLVTYLSYRRTARSSIEA